MAATAPINITGTITNSGTGSGVTTISSVIAATVTNVTENAPTSQLTLGGANLFTGASTTTVSAGILKATAATALGPAAGGGGNYRFQRRHSGR